MIDYVSFLKECLTPFHTVKYIKDLLNNCGFKEYKINDKVQTGKYYYIYRTMMVIFKIPKNPSFFRIIGTHNDSPVLKLKPNPFFSSGNMTMLNLKTYGGGLFHTFFDRPLVLGGLIISKDGEKVITMKDVAYIPSLAPHSAREIYKDGFTYNREDHLKAILLKEELKELLSDALSFDLSLIEERITDTGEFILSGRQDNLSSTYCAVKAIIDDVSNDFVSMVSIFDHEEIGSETVSGAQSSVFSSLIDNISRHLNIHTFTTSMFLSADAGHCDHPNYAERADKHHPVKFNEGTIIKYGSGYATEVYGSSFIKTLNGKYQIMNVKNNVPCGGTIGSMVSVKLGIPSVDVGVPLLGMHSCCEIVAKKDIDFLSELMVEFFNKNG